MNAIDQSLMPNFLIIGAGKSGTTSLYYYLKQHPQLFMSEVKEPNFFALEGKKLLMAEEDKDEINFFPWAVTDLAGYQNLFRNAKPGYLKGESSTMYLYMDQAPEKIKSYVPEVKMIGIFRQPAERLYSRYLHLARDNRMSAEDLKQVFDKSSLWWKRNDLVQEGFYFRHLSRYYDLFPKENIKVFLYEDLIKSPAETIKSIYSFLGVETDFMPDTKMKFNESGIIKNKLYDRLVGRNSLIKNAIKKTLPGIFQKAKSSYAIKNIVNKLRKANLERPPFDPAMKKRITDEIYKEDILKFQNLIQRDLEHWLPQ